MRSDYIPSKDVELEPFVQNVVTTLDGNEVAFGVTDDLRTALATALSAYTAGLLAVNTTASSAAVAVQNKKALKDALVVKTRQILNVVKANIGTTDAMLVDLGLTPPDRIPTAVSVGADLAVLSVDFTQRGEHTISAVSSLSPNSKAKPAWARGFKLWMKVAGVQPADNSTMELIGVVTSGKHRLVFEESQYGSQAFYVASWTTASGKDGATGDFTNATVTK